MKIISKQCEEEIKAINKLIESAIKRIQEAQKRAESAEKKLAIIKQTLDEKIKEAYYLGFKNAQNDKEENESGGGSKEEETRLVLKTD